MASLKNVICAILLIFTTYLGAEEAGTLTRGTLMFSLSDLSISTRGKYNSLGGIEKSTGLIFNNLGASLKMGVTEDLTAEIQWIPGINLYHQFLNDEDTSAPQEVIEHMIFTGSADISGGVKFKIHESNNMKFAVGGGINYPLDKLDRDKEINAFLKGEDYRVFSRNGTESLAVWTRLFWDINLSDSFMVNFFNQTLYHFPHTGYDKYDVIDYITVYYNILNSTGDPVIAESTANGTLEDQAVYHHFLYIDFETDLHYKKEMVNGTTIDFSFPVHYSYIPETLIDSNWNDRENGHIITLNPSFSFRTESFLVPLEMKLQLSLPLWGINRSRTTLIALQTKVFFDFY